jgi:hypothetical protein
MDATELARPATHSLHLSIIFRSLFHRRAAPIPFEPPSARPPIRFAAAVSIMLSLAIQSNKNLA